MTARRGLRRGVLHVHLVCSVGWIGGAIAYLVLGLVAARSTDPETWTSTWTAMELIGWRALVPLVLATVVTGVVLALVSPWGLLDHYWVVVSLVATVAAATVLVLHMPDVSAVAAAVREGTVGQRPGGDLGHTIGGLVVLLGVHTLNVVKPSGLTRRGWRRRTGARRGATGR